MATSGVKAQLLKKEGEEGEVEGGRGEGGGQGRERGGEKKWRHTTTRSAVQPKMADITASYPARHCNASSC